LLRQSVRSMRFDFALTPAGKYVFHVLISKPAVPELIRTDHFIFVVDVDGSIRFQGNVEEVLKKK
jgi:hypothetical protein